jgi:hypothetical protein
VHIHIQFIYIQVTILLLNGRSTSIQRPEKGRNWRLHIVWTVQWYSSHVASFLCVSSLQLSHICCFVGYPEFRFDVGSGPAVIRSDRPINLGEWHSVQLSRSRADGKMIVDGEDVYTRTIHGSFQGLDLMEPLYVGGHPTFSNVHKLAGHSKGFVGKLNFCDSSSLFTLMTVKDSTSILFIVRMRQRAYNWIKASTTL